MKVVEFTRFTIHCRALECQICHLPPKPHYFGCHFYLCDAGHVVCQSCMLSHKAICGDSLSTDCCHLLEDIASRIEIKCACGGYFQYDKLKEHQINCQPGICCSSVWRKCKLRAALVCCSACRAILRPPVFKHGPGHRLCCADCRHANRHKDIYIRCPDLDYLFKCVMVKTRRPYYSPYNEDETNTALAGSNNILGKTEGKAPSKVGKTDKHIAEWHEGMSEYSSSYKMDEEEDESPSKLETGNRVVDTAFKTSTYKKKANIATASGKKSDEYESTRPPVGHSTIIGKTKRKAPSKVRKMDNHIVDSDVVESEASSDDMHPETGNRVAETVLKTTAANKRSKIATSSTSSSAWMTSSSG